ncbi:uncharacterized protein LOC129976443 isoform X1 [Argiope bruennichi]|uniref:uncharacterized protein LOC129976443 isoform X1 n=1 Tax=Argiope bruennichi TaxID=94029 RepID=UPI0024953151|nr:uncharacterized protein LOC129976443 isoform X1 [Argiope bruennichi]
MSSYSNHQSEYYGRSKWLPHLERLLSASCIAWCLQASFKEHSKSATIAYVGGASSIYVTDFFLRRLASRSSNRGILRAGGFLFAVGISWCLNKAFKEHPQAAMKAFLAGALSTCLGKAIIFGDPLASWEESRRPKPPEKKVPEVSDMYYHYAAVPVRLQKNVEDAAKILRKISQEFHSIKIGEGI